MPDVEAHPEREIHLRDYLHVLDRRKWLILTILVVSFTIAAIRTFRERPLYQAAAQIMIQKETPNVISIQQVMQASEDYTDFFNTQYKVLQSRALAALVAERLRIWEYPEFGAAAGKGGAAEGSAQDRESRLDAAADAVLGRITIEPVKNTFLVNIHARALDPKLAAVVANTLADLYIEQNLRLKVDTTQQAGSYLNEQSAEARQKLAAAERALQRFNETNNVISFEERQQGMIQKLAQLNAELAGARTQRQDLENRNEKLRELRKQSGDNAPSGVEYYLSQFAANTAALRAELNALEADLVEQSKVYTAKHPKIVALTGKIQALRRKLADEVDQAARGLRNEYDIAARREQALLAQIAEEEQRLQALNAKGVEHAVLKREVESTARIYELLVSREKETGVLSGIRTNNVRLVDRAQVPRFPVSPNRPRALLLGLIVGLAGGLGAAFFLEYLDDSVADPDDLERHVHVPLLGPVPILEPKITGERSRDLIALQEPKSLYAESYRTVRTSLLFSSPDNPPRTFVVTSSGPQEGKTLTATNLAVTVALTGKRVLLIDADMRKPRIHAVFGLGNEFGLSSLIGGSSEVGLALKRTPVETLLVMTSGPVPPNPSELLGSGRMAHLLDLLRDKFDVIIMDCTPLIAVTDATVLAARADGVILVIKAGATRRTIVRRAVKQLADVQARISGVVLNQVNVKKSSYYYPSYYARYYGSAEEGPTGSPPAGAAAGRSRSEDRT